MKRWQKSKVLPKLGICTGLFVLAELLRVFVPRWTQNERYGHIFAILEILLALYTARFLVSLILPEPVKSKRTAGASVLGFLRRLFRPFAQRIREAYARQERRIFGTDEKTIILPWDLAGKWKKRPDIREKIDPDRCESAAEKIRALYTVRILRLHRQGMEIPVSCTPGEIRRAADPAEKELLFPTYEQVRYGNCKVTDAETIKRCEEEVMQKNMNNIS